MTTLEQIIQAAMVADADLRLAALCVLQRKAHVTDTSDEIIQNEPYLTCRTLAQRLGVSPCTVWRWQPPSHDLGGRRRYRFSEVQAYLASDDFERRAAALRAERRNGFAAKRTDEQSQAKPDGTDECQQTAGPARCKKFRTTTSE
ncbi:MAG TPA: hypothetical protein P5186_16255 [Candidatus Paceibacterota bacterium]|nr:hypothetical protein [Candidatus Paceibacterota bacterium]